MPNQIPAAVRSVPIGTSATLWLLRTTEHHEGCEASFASFPAPQKKLESQSLVKFAHLRGPEGPLGSIRSHDLTVRQYRTLDQQAPNRQLGTTFKVLQAWVASRT